MLRHWTNRAQRCEDLHDGPHLTKSSPDEGKQEREQDVGPVPLVLRRYGDHTQEEEDEGLRDSGQHFDNMADGCAGPLGDVLLHVVLHGYGTGYNAAGSETPHDSSHHMMSEMEERPHVLPQYKPSPVQSENVAPALFPLITPSSM